jgi:hypothetical protein
MGTNGYDPAREQVKQPAKQNDDPLPALVFDRRIRLSDVLPQNPGEKPGVFVFLSGKLLGEL